MSWSRKLLLPAVALMTAAATMAVAGPSTATTTTPASRAEHGSHQVAPSYTNPLKLALPAGGMAESCADPDVIHGAGSDRHWYLYCTSDALTATELGSDGKPLLHNVPMFSSLDLIHWTYRGDAFPTKPSWVSGFLWAPEINYSNGQYRLYYAASDTSLPGGGSAIGGATSSSPPRAWT